MIKEFVANKIAKPFKSCGVAGALRWKILYWAYKITGWHIRHEEWKFVLKYLPKLHNDEQNINVLDVGCSRTLFAYELQRRGYNLTGIDLEEPAEYYGMKFIRGDITKRKFSDFDFVICISVLEHIGNRGRGNVQLQILALRNMIESLAVGGRLLLTIPTDEFAQGHIWHGFTWSMLVDMLNEVPQKVRAVESTERLGQMCVAIERCQ